MKGVYIPESVAHGFPIILSYSFIKTIYNAHLAYEQEKSLNTVACSAFLTCCNVKAKIHYPLFSLSTFYKYPHPQKPKVTSPPSSWFNMLLLTTWNDHMNDDDYFLYRLNKCLTSPLIATSENQQLTQLVHQLIQAKEQGLIVQLVSELKQLLRTVEIRIETVLHVRAIIDCHLKYNAKSLPINTLKIGTA